MKRNFNVLLVDSHPADATKIKTFLEQNAEPSFQVWHHSTCEKAVNFFKEKSTKIDVIILDLFIDDARNPKEIYEFMQRSAGNTPIIAVTSQAAHSLAREVVGEGAAGIIVRERFRVLPNRLIDSIEFSIIRNKLLSELKEKNAEEAWQHKRILHWMTGGYSVESETGPVVESAESKKGR